MNASLQTSWLAAGLWTVGLLAAFAAEEKKAVPAAVQKPEDVLKEPDGTEFRLAYFPSWNRLRFIVLSPPAQFQKWELQLTAAGKTDVLARAAGQLPFSKAGQTLEIPTLAEGTYAVTLMLVATDGSRRELRRTFERRRFPWEQNQLGRERVVIPPFTPLAVDARQPSVACVLRQHQLDSAGLWRQVTSQDRELLAAPMRLEIETGGKVHVADGGRVAFTEQAADRVSGQASWQAGPVRGRTEFAFEYDGLARIALHLEPCSSRIDAMQLVIPMQTRETWLMHPVTDLLRFHFAGRIPDGKGKLWEYGGKVCDVRYTETGTPDADGRVWDSRHVSRHQLPAPFVPYMWLGGPERGLCWCAENDRDWSLDPQRPMLEIRRRGETTSLIVRFVTNPVALTRPRQIAFGLMATPAKPMPAVPANFRRWWAGSMAAKTTGTVHFGFMGACYYWGAAGPCFAFYPAFQDFSIYDEFARLRRTGQMDRGYTDKWLERFRAPEFAALLPTYRAHVNWTQNFFQDKGWREAAGAGKTAYAIPYTNARAINWGAEVQTFLDEWSTLDVADPRWPGEERFLRRPRGGYLLNAYRKLIEPGETSGIAYAIDPVPSWQDLVLFYHRRMLETFADGIYFDDFFLSPNYNPLGPGYVDDEGRLRPGVSIFGFRELAKRIAVMQHQLGRRPLLFIHMTNTNIVPFLSFGTLLLDHEWRDQGDFRKRDLHERLQLDEDTSLLLAQSTGFQSGCIGVIHDLLHGPQRAQFIRGGLAVALTHEMKFPLYWEELGRTVAEQLSNFGYGQPDCRVYRYWDDEQPLKTSGVPVKTLVLSRGGQALVVVASYGPAGGATLELDRRRLGLPDDVTAVNAETSAAIDRTGPGRFQLTLPRHDFCLVRVQPSAK